MLHRPLLSFFLSFLLVKFLLCYLDFLSFLLVRFLLCHRDSTDLNWTKLCCSCCIQNWLLLCIQPSGFGAAVFLALTWCFLYSQLLKSENWTGSESSTGSKRAPEPVGSTELAGRLSPLPGAVKAASALTHLGRRCSLNAVFVGDCWIQHSFVFP